MDFIERLFEKAVDLGKEVVHDTSVGIVKAVAPPGWSDAQIEDKAHKIENAIEIGGLIASGFGEAAGVLEVGGALVEGGIEAFGGFGVASASAEEVALGERMMANEIGDGGVGWLRNIENQATRGQQIVRERALQFGESIGIDEGMRETGSEIYRAAQSASKVKHVMSAAFQEGGNTTIRDGMLRQRILPNVKSMLVPMQEKEGGDEPNLTSIKPLVDEGLAAYKDFFQLGKRVRYDDEEHLSYGKSKHRKLEGAPHLPVSTAFSGNVKHEKDLRNHTRTASGKLQSHYKMNIGERIAMQDIMKTGYGPIHYGSSSSWFRQPSTSFSQKNILSSF